MKNSSLLNREKISFRSRYHGTELYSPDCFYNSVLADMPISWLDRIQIKIDCTHIDLDDSFFRGKNNHYIKYLVRDYRIPFTHIKTNYGNKIKYLYIDLLVIPLERSLYYSFLDIIIDLLAFKIIRHNRKTENGVREEAIKIINHSILNELEFRIDISFDTGGKKLVSILNESYGDENGKIKLSSWNNRHTSGYLLKAYERKNFIRIETVLYNTNFKNIPIKKLLTIAEQLLHKAEELALIFIMRICQQKPKLRIIIPFVDTTDSLKYRCKELHLDNRSAQEMMRQGQIANTF